MKQTIDQPISQLVLDLEERGLLDRTLIVLASEFGRDMIQEGKPDKPVKDQVKLRPADRDQAVRHAPALYRSRVRADVQQRAKKGHLYGRTDDERPCKVVEKPVKIEDLHATLYHAMGIQPDYGDYVERRPFYVTKDGKGQPILDVLVKQGTFLRRVVYPNH